MKTIFSYILVGAGIGIAIFGASLMNHGVLGMNGRCVAETINGAICPQNPIAEAFFHIDALRFFSTAVFTPTLFATFIVLLALIGCIALSQRLRVPTNSVAMARSFVHAPPVPSAIRFRHWLAFHELSPPDFVLQPAIGR